MGLARFRRRDRGRARLVGYTKYLNEMYAEGALKHPPQIADIAYKTVKLFLMGSPDTTGLPVTIEIARILAPIVAG